MTNIDIDDFIDELYDLMGAHPFDVLELSKGYKPYGQDKLRRDITELFDKHFDLIAEKEEETI